MRHADWHDDFARRMARRDSQVRVPRVEAVLKRMATVTGVDHSAGYCAIQMAGSLVELPEVAYELAYHPTHLPQVGHTCWVHVNGSDVVVTSRHIGPFNIISL